MNSKQILAQNLRQNIYDTGLTELAYAKEIGLPYNTLLYVLSGQRATSLDTLDRIAEGTGIDPWELIAPQQLRKGSER